MMKVESRSQLTSLAGRKQEPQNPTPAPGPDLMGVVDGLAASVRGAAEVAAQGVAMAAEAQRGVLALAQIMRDSRPKMMFAEVERDELGRMSRVVISVE